MFWSALFFIIGIVLGSFFNVVGLRVPLNRGFVKGKSACLTCHTELSWLELIPVLSYAAQKGKCRSCFSSISPLYPLMELSSGLLFLLAYQKSGFLIEFLIALLLISLSMIIMVADLRYMLIPNNVLLFYLPLFLFVIIINPLEPWHNSIFGALCGLLLIGSIILISDGGMGKGDMKFLALIGLVLGFEKVLLTFFIAVCLGALMSVCLLTLKRVSRKQRIPFAPYLITGALASYFYGVDLLRLYSGLIGGSFSM